MKSIPVNTRESMDPQQRRDLVVLLRLLEGWLLDAEPSTIRELDRYLTSVGVQSDASVVLEGIGQVLKRL